MWLLFSGGVDSVYIAWDLLQQGITPTLHYVRMHQWADAEQAAAQWFADRWGLPLVVTEERVLRSDPRNGILDADAVIAEAIHVMAEPQPILQGNNPEDLRRPLAKQRAKDGAIRKRFSQADIRFPLLEPVPITRGEVLARLPKELYEKTYSCRSQTNPHPCGICDSCLERKNIIPKPFPINRR